MPLTRPTAAPPRKMGGVVARFRYLLYALLMEPTTATRVRTATGTVHAFTIGRTYYSRGETLTNDSTSAAGKADCGAATSSAARFTDEATNCPKCGA